MNYSGGGGSNKGNKYNQVAMKMEDKADIRHFIEKQFQDF